MDLTTYKTKVLGTLIDHDWVYWWQCFCAWTLVLCKWNIYKKIEDLKIWDYIISPTWENKILEIFINNSEASRIDTNISTIYQTEDHPYQFKNWLFWSILEWEDVELYLPGTYKESWLTNNQLLFFWFWLWDWDYSIRSNWVTHQIRITYWKWHKENFINSLWLKWSIQNHLQSDNAFVFNLNKKWNELLFDLISETKDKIIKRYFTNKEAHLILKWFLEADWSIKNNSIAFSNTNKDLLLKLQQFAIRTWCITFSIREAAKAWTDTTITVNWIKKHIKRWKDLYKWTYAHKSTKKKWFYNKVIKTKKLWKKDVYNLYVDWDNLFIVENYIVHNCVDLIKNYTATVLDLRLWTFWGSALTGWNNSSNTFTADKWIKIKNNPSDLTQMPKAWDIVFWKYWIYWHVAIVLNAYLNWIEVLEQNMWDWNGQWIDDVIKVTTRWYKDILWWYAFIWSETDILKKNIIKLTEENKILKDKLDQIKIIIN
jgi:hypothetical protein